MYRLVFKRRRLRRQRKKLLTLYSGIAYALKNYSKNPEGLYYSTFNLTLPKRQQFFSILNLKTKRFIGFSAGKLLAIFGRKAKFFKRSFKNIFPICLQLKNSYGALLKYIYLFYIKNFNKRQLLFFKKFNGIVNPEIFYLVHRQSFIPHFLPTRRIKKKVLKGLSRE